MKHNFKFLGNELREAEYEDHSGPMKSINTVCFRNYNSSLTNAVIHIVTVNGAGQTFTPDSIVAEMDDTVVFTLTRRYQGP
jgi:hypothetical protein